jgi:hypothetical protein
VNTVLQYTPGMQATIFFELKDGYGRRMDDGYVPVVQQIVLPGFTTASGYPQNMVELDTGLYYFQFTLPVGAVAVGSYLVDVAYLNAVTGYVNNEIFQIVCYAVSGNYGVTTF